MNTDTATISLKHYNELRDFKKNIEKNHTIHVNVDNYNCNMDTYVSESDAIKRIVELNEKINTMYSNLRDKYVYLLNNLYPIEELGRMSIKDFLRARKLINKRK